MGAPGSGAGSGGAVSGSRLKVQVIAGGDGSQFSRIWDSKRGEPCQFQTAEDGTLRCMPFEGVQVRWEGFYADPDCTEPFYTTSVDACPPKYGRDAQAPEPCGTVGKFYALRKVDPKVGMVYSRNPNTGKCSGGPGDFTPQHTYRGTRLPPSEFVQGTPMP